MLSRIVWASSTLLRYVRIQAGHIVHCICSVLWEGGTCTPPPHNGSTEHLTKCFLEKTHEETKLPQILLLTNSYLKKKKKKGRHFFCTLHYQAVGILHPPGKVIAMYKIMMMFLELLQCCHVDSEGKYSTTDFSCQTQSRNLWIFPKLAGCFQPCSYQLFALCLPFFLVSSYSLHLYPISHLVQVIISPLPCHLPPLFYFASYLVNPLLSKAGQEARLSIPQCSSIFFQEHVTVLHQKAKAKRGNIELQTSR